MVCYAKSCGCFSLRYGVILIASIDIILAVYLLTTSAKDMTKEEVKKSPHLNGTVISDNKSANSNSGNQALIIVSIVIQVVAILFGIAMITVAVMDQPKYRKVLLGWVAWTCASVVIMIIVTIVRALTEVILWIEILITLFLAVYLTCCMWFVMSYYKMLE
eukprot:gene9396-17101_t